MGKRVQRLVFDDNGDRRVAQAQMSDHRSVPVDPARFGQVNSQGREWSTPDVDGVDGPQEDLAMEGMHTHPMAVLLAHSSLFYQMIPSSPSILLSSVIPSGMASQNQQWIQTMAISALNILAWRKVRLSTAQ
jgi:hypothetical protein